MSSPDRSIGGPGGSLQAAGTPDRAGGRAPGNVRGPWQKDWAVHRLMRRCMAACAPLVNGRLLDLGCGDQPYRDLLAPRAKRYVAMERGRKRYAGLPVTVWGDAVRLPFLTGSFQTVVCNQVLEHVPEPAVLVAEAARVMAPGGCLILTAPHIWGVHEPPHDYYRFTPYGLSYLAGRAGLEVLDLQALAGFWVTAGTRLCYYLSRFERGPAAWAVRPVYAAVQAAALLLDRLHCVESEAWNHLIVARKPGGRPSAAADESALTSRAEAAGDGP